MANNNNNNNNYYYYYYNTNNNKHFEYPKSLNMVNDMGDIL